MREDVGIAALAPVVLLHAASELHPAVLGALHQDHLVRPTGGVERLPLAVVPQFAYNKGGNEGVIVLTKEGSLFKKR